MWTQVEKVTPFLSQAQAFESGDQVTSVSKYIDLITSYRHLQNDHQYSFCALTFQITFLLTDYVLRLARMFLVKLEARFNQTMKSKQHPFFTSQKSRFPFYNWVGY